MNQFTLPAAVIIMVCGVVVLVVSNDGLGVVLIAVGASFLAVDQTERRRPK